MKPAGPERDREIAEIRGECIHANKTDRKGIIKYPNKVCPDCGLIFFNDASAIKPYSTDISCAMELWKEMATSNEGNWLWLRIERDCNSAKTNVEFMALNGKELFGGKLSTRHEYEGETETDAISGTWLKWKGTE